MKNFSRLFALPLLFLAMLTSSCSKDLAEIEFNCDAFSSALFDANERDVEAQIQPLLDTLKPKKTNSDETGHAQNLEEFIAHLESECGDFTIGYCYACLESLPPQSRLTFDFGEDEIRTIDLTTPDDGPMTFRRVY